MMQIVFIVSQTNSQNGLVANGQPAVVVLK